MDDPASTSYVSAMNRTALLPIALLAACTSAPSTAQQPGPTPPKGGKSPAVEARAEQPRPFVSAVVADFVAPWAMTFLPDGRMLVTEKAGQLKLVTADGRTQSIVAGTPAVDSAGQGGLMDVVLHPRFAQTRMVYLSWSEAGAGGKHVALGRGKLSADGTKLEGFTTIYRAFPDIKGDGHYSGRIALGPDGHLFFAAGERQQFEPAQDKGGVLGKVLRLTDDGKPAPGNPLASQGFKPEVWSYGHRNLLGLAFDAQGRLWEQEMGPRHGDELNLVLPGRNYGYPRVSNGNHYDGRDIPDHKPGDGFEAPKYSWNPAISPAGLTIYQGALFPAWRGDAFIGGMNKPGLVRVDLDGERAGKAEFWDMDGQRIREVESGPDGALYLLEDGLRGSQGRLLKLTPAASRVASQK